MHADAHWNLSGGTAKSRSGLYIQGHKAGGLCQRKKWL